MVLVSFNEKIWRMKHNFHNDNNRDNLYIDKHDNFLKKIFHG